MTHASLCTGIGACELAATWMGWKNAFSCEVDEFCNRILKYHYPNAIHYGNILEQDFREWRGRIDVLTAGFPCQPFSIAGKRNGADDDRYLWPEVLRAIEEIRPTWFTGENVSGITSVVFPGSEITVGRYTDTTGESYKATEMRQQFVIDRICNDLESVGYQVQPVIIPACAVGAPHRRDQGLPEAAYNGLLPTPMASDATTGAIIGKNDEFVQTGNGVLRKINQNGTNRSVGLARMVQLLPTPTANDGKNSTLPESQTGRDSLAGTVSTSRVGKTSQLNPLFVTEMMGFPVNYLVLPFQDGDKPR